MSEAVKTLVVFCEGAHDIAFLSQVFRHCLGFTRNSELKLSEFPAPFNQLFETSVQHNQAGDLSLDMARKFFLPDQVLEREKEQRLVLLFNSGGVTKTAALQQFLKQLLPLLKRAKVFPGDATKIVDTIDYLFTYDADDKGVEYWVQSLKNDFAEIGSTPFITNDFDKSQQTDHGYIQDNKAVFVWGENTKQGTLEDWLIPMVQQKHAEKLNTAYATLDSMFDWEQSIAQLSKPKEIISAQSKRHKAAITLLGQKKKPGGSMTVILDQAKLLTKASYKGSDNIKEFVNFLGEFTDVCD